MLISQWNTKLRLLVTWGHILTKRILDKPKGFQSTPEVGAECVEGRREGGDKVSSEARGVRVGLGERAGRCTMNDDAIPIEDFLLPRIRESPDGT